MADATTQGISSFISEMGVLQRVARTGWWFPGNKQPESVAEHSFRVGVIGGADRARVALTCLSTTPRRRGSGTSRTSAAGTSRRRRTVR